MQTFYNIYANIHAVLYSLAMVLTVTCTMTGFQNIDGSLQYKIVAHRVERWYLLMNFLVIALDFRLSRVFFSMLDVYFILMLFIIFLFYSLLHYLAVMFYAFIVILHIEGHLSLNCQTYTSYTENPKWNNFNPFHVN